MNNFQARIENAKFGFHRAYVVDNKDKNNYGQVMVFIPDTMSTTQSPPTTGIWAMPANLTFGGTNTDITDQGTLNSGSSMIPVVGTWWWIFFENGNFNRPFYFAPVSIQNKTIMPENTEGNQPYNKWVVMRSPQGKEILISDDPSDSQLLLTGSKKNPSEYLTVKDNQSIISINDSNSNDMILLQDYNDNFIKINTPNNEILVSATAEVVITDGTNIISLIKSSKQITITNELSTISLSGKDINITSIGGNITVMNSGLLINMDSSKQAVNVFSPKDINLNATENVNINSGVLISQNGGGVQGVSNLATTTSLPIASSLQKINNTVSNIRGHIMSAASSLPVTAFTKLQGIVNNTASTLQNNNSTAMTTMNSSIATNSTAAINNVTTASATGSDVNQVGTTAINNINNTVNNTAASVNSNTTSATNSLQQQVQEFIATNNINGTSADMLLSAVSSSVDNVNSVTLDSNTTMFQTISNETTSSITSLTSMFAVPNSTGLVSPTLQSPITTL